MVLESGTNDGKAVFVNRQQEVTLHLESLIKKMKGRSYPVIKDAQAIVVSPPYSTKAEATGK